MFLACRTWLAPSSYMSTMHSDNSDNNLDIAEVAHSVFASGFFESGLPIAAHRAETPLRLAYALNSEKVSAVNVKALGLALREIGEVEPVQPERKVSRQQQQQVQMIVQDVDLPASLKIALTVAAQKLVLRRDLYALSAVFLTVAEKLDAINATLRLGAR